MAKRVFTYYVAQTKPYTYILNSMPVMTFIQNPISLIIIWSQTILFHSCLWWPSAVTVLVCTPNINLHIITIAFVKVAQDRYYWLITWVDSSTWIHLLLEFEGRPEYLSYCISTQDASMYVHAGKEWNHVHYKEVKLFGLDLPHYSFLHGQTLTRVLHHETLISLPLLFLMLEASQFANSNYKIFSAMMTMHPMISSSWFDIMAPPHFFLLF